MGIFRDDASPIFTRIDDAIDVVSKASKAVFSLEDGLLGKVGKAGALAIERTEAFQPYDYRLDVNFERLIPAIGTSFGGSKGVATDLAIVTAVGIGIAASTPLVPSLAALSAGAGLLRTIRFVRSGDPSPIKIVHQDGSDLPSNSFVARFFSS